MFDRDMKYIAASRRYLADYHLEEQNLARRSHYEVFPEMPESWKEIHRRCLAGAVEKADEDPFLRADGTVDWVRWEIHPGIRSPVKSAAFCCFSEVITERVQARARLRESEARYRQLLDVAPVGVAVHVDGKVVFTNPAGARLLGAASPDKLIGRPIATVIHPDNLPQAAVRIQRMMAGEEGLYPTEDRYVRLDGSVIPVEVTAVPLTYDGKPGVQVMVSDISERKRAEEELHQLNSDWKNVWRGARPSWR
ncbi:MAG: PAS domain S-box protein [bacterium]|nr:PAS domain S-box protein [bacterium]